MELSSLSGDFDKCNNVLLAALDYEFERYNGGIVFDGWDPFVERHNKILRNVSGAQKRRNVAKLAKILEEILQRYPGNSKLAEFIFKRTGLEIEVLPGMQESISDTRKVSVQTSGNGDHAVTTIVIELPGGSGPIYSIRGLHPDLTASWKDDHTIIIKTPPQRDELLKHHQVSSFGHLITIEYLEM